MMKYPSKRFIDHGRIIAVSNRSPCILQRTQDHNHPKYAVGGLVSTLDAMFKITGGIWVGGAELNNSYLPHIDTKFPGNLPYELKLNYLSETDILNYYNGFSNSILWPICHSFINEMPSCNTYWDAYQKVNTGFATSVLNLMDSEDLIWIHDYHLSLVPCHIRSQFPDTSIIHCWHIPFPEINVFQMLPWARKILSSMLHSNLITFHLQSYVENFLKCVNHLLNYEIDHQSGLIIHNNKRTLVKAIPIGIDYKYWQQICNLPLVKEQSLEIAKRFFGKTIGLSVDRLDYTKGILERIRSVEFFLENYPQYKNHFVLIQIAIPGRTEIIKYRAYQHEVIRAATRINQEFGNENWQPIICIYEQMTHKELAAYYKAADFIFVLPVSDGMNLVVKEYVASQPDNGERGAVLLSETAGAAEEFGFDAQLVDPLNVEEVSAALKQVMELCPIIKTSKMKRLQEKVKQRDLEYWLYSNLNELNAIRRLGEVESKFYSL